MLTYSKTFRLFISSTFSDFQQEREILQCKVFPKIKNYCQEKGYTFQSIDLRWGISNEAQLDQKTLEICLSEVRSCKIHAYPNFLIMLGDRYGWVPLPNIIIKDEFEILLEHTSDVNRKYLTDWYIKDKNQLPTSYILKEREDKYIDYTAWEVVENKIRDILQDAASHSNLNDSVKDKYFVSATEAEATEGIVPYLTKTEYQQKLLQLIPNLEQTDPSHIFGFFRNINTTTTIEDKFVSTDYDKAQQFKEKIKKILPDVNSLNINTSQITKDKLDEAYLDKFETSIIKFLKHQIDKQVSQDNKSNNSNLKIEKFQQEYYLNKKLENFLGQEKILNEIQNYINNDINHPLIICGKSGIGKSSIIAKAIENTSNKTNKKIIYRFIGVTPNLTSTKNILTSILEELSIYIEDKKFTEKENQFLSDIDKEENNFVNFSDKMYEQIMRLQEDVVIFIDAVDQLTNDDQFLWLPNKLPSNVKIIISALKDREYKSDSKYFYALEDKVSNYIEIEPFNKPIELLELLLSHKKRTLQPIQKECFLSQYEKVKTPLYVYIASTQIQYWRSSDVVDKNIFLSFTQKDIVKDFIENLSLAHHHDKRLVQKIFSYIVSSNDGLSEYEILELLNTDKDFIKSIAPDTWHTNTTQELPLVIWTRLYNHIKYFLSRKIQDHQKLLYFFHREFINVITSQENQKEEHEDIIEATQKLILKHQNENFSNNRWGKLYITVLGEYFFKYKDEEIIIKYCDFIRKIKNKKFLVKFIDEIQKLGYTYNMNNQYNHSLVYRKITYFNLLSLTHNKDHGEWLFFLVQSSHNLASTLYSLNILNEAINIERKNIEIVENITDKEKRQSIDYMRYLDPEFNQTINNEAEINALSSFIWLDQDLIIKSVLSSCYSKQNETKKAIALDQESCHICNLLYNAPNGNGQYWTKHYLVSLGNLAESLFKNSEKQEAVQVQEEALKVVEKEYSEYTGYLVEDYARILNGLSVFLNDIDPIKSKQLSEKSHQVISDMYSKNKNRYSNQIHAINSNKISMGIDDGDIYGLELYFNESIKILDNLEYGEKEKWLKDVSNTLLVKSYELYKAGKTKQAIDYYRLNKMIIQKEYQKDKNYWAKFYVERLISLAKVLTDNKLYQEANIYLKESVDISQKYFNFIPEEWGNLYTKALNNLSITYTFLNNNNEALIYNKRNLDISYKLFQKDDIKWYRAYYYALNTILGSYVLNGNNEKADECTKKMKELESDEYLNIFKKLSEKDPKKYNETYREILKFRNTSKKLNYLDYVHKLIIALGIFFVIKYLIFS